MINKRINTVTISWAINGVDLSNSENINELANIAKKPEDYFQSIQSYPIIEPILKDYKIPPSIIQGCPTVPFYFNPILWDYKGSEIDSYLAILFCGDPHSIKLRVESEADIWKDMDHHAYIDIREKMTEKENDIINSANDDLEDYQGNIGIEYLGEKIRTYCRSIEYGNLIKILEEEEDILKAVLRDDVVKTILFSNGFKMKGQKEMPKSTLDVTKYIPKHVRDVVEYIVGGTLSIVAGLEDYIINAVSHREPKKIIEAYSDWVITGT